MKNTLLLLILLPLLSFGQETDDTPADSSVMNALHNVAIASALYETGNYEDAIFFYSVAIGISSEVAEAGGLYYNRGCSYLKLGNNSAAISDLSEAIRINPINTGAHYNRGLAYVASGNYRDALTDFSEVISINPYDATAYFGRSLANFSLGLPFCSDLEKACELGYEDGCELFNEGCR